MTIKAIVFDMDGTLLNTLDDLADSTNHALIEHGFDSHPAAAYKLFVGSGARELIKRALPEHARSNANIDPVLNTYKVHYENNWANKTHLYSGISKLLDQATQQSLKIAILTNKPQSFATACAEHFLSGWPISIVQGQVDGIPHKPDAAMSSLVTKALEIQPNEVLYLGDSDIDMITARNAGYRAVGVTWGFRSEAELRNAGADIIIHTPIDAIELW